MDLEIVSQLADLKNSILYGNRFFVSNDPFLLEFEKCIRQDLVSKSPN